MFSKHSYLTFRNAIWIILLLVWPAFLLMNSLIAGTFFEFAEPFIVLLWITALSFSPKVVIDHRRLKKRIRDHQCTACGYDLRATLGVGRIECPECGEPIPAWREFVFRNAKP